MSDAERDAEYQRLRSEGDRLHTEWLATVDIDALDMRSLPRSEMPAFYLAGEATLTDAVAKADAIVAGTVSQLHPTEGVAIDTVFSVDQTIKGAAGSSVVISQAGRLQPTQDRSGIEILEAGNAPLLFPGDRAVLLLQKTEPAGESSGGYYIQGYSGWYKIVNGTVQTTGFGDLGTSVAGKTEAEFVAAVNAAVAEAAAVSP